MALNVLRRSFSLAPRLHLLQAAARKVVHDESAKEFFIPLEGGVKAQLLYYQAKPDMWDLYSTRVPDEFSGQGVAADLSKAALDYAAQNNIRVLLTCSYLRSFVEKNPEPYQKLVVRRDSE